MNEGDRSQDFEHITDLLGQTSNIGLDNLSRLFQQLLVQCGQHLRIVENNEPGLLIVRSDDVGNSIADQLSIPGEYHSGMLSQPADATQSMAIGHASPAYWPRSSAP